MKLAPAQLAKHLQGGLAPVYIVSGDDPLLCQEAADAIRTAARQHGFDERQVFSADASFDWGTLLQAGASMSLFAEKRLLELRLPSGKPGDKGAAAFIEYCSRPAEDTVLLISLPKLDGSAQKTKWGKALVEGAGGSLVSTQPTESSPAGPFTRIGLNLRILVSVQALQTVLYELETRRPLVVIDEMLVLSRTRGARQRRRAAGTNPGQLDVRLQLGAFLAPGGGA